MESPTNRTQQWADTRPERGGMTISDAFHVYRQVSVFKNQSPKTEEHLMIVCKLLIAFFGDTEIEKLNFDLIRRWKTAIAKTRSQSTVRGYVIKLRVVLKHCQKLGLNVVDPELIPVPQRPDTVPSFISSDEVTLLIKASLRLRAKAIIALLYASGIRISELCSLDRGQIQDRSFTVVGKGGRARLCFIDERAEKYINQYLEKRTDNNPALFISQTGARISPTNIQLLVRTSAVNAGLKGKHITPHTLRHSFATNLLRNNTNMRYVQVMLGHKDLNTTAMYSHVINPDLREQYVKHHTI